MIPVTKRHNNTTGMICGKKQTGEVKVQATCVGYLCVPSLSCVCVKKLIVEAFYEM